MSTTAIDYDALAKQHGGVAAASNAVDYDALAKQHGGTVDGGVAGPDTLGAKPPQELQKDADPPRGVPVGEISSRPHGIMPWLEDVQGDVKHGTTQTLPGRILHALGAPGTETGVSEATAHAMPNPVGGVVKVAHGVGRFWTGHPIKGINEELGGLGETTGLAPLSMVHGGGGLPMLAAGGAAQQLTSGGLKKVGADPDWQEFGGNAAGIAADVAAGTDTPGMVRKIGAASDPNKVYHSYLDPVKDTPQRFPGVIPERITNRLTTAMQNRAQRYPGTAERIGSGKTTLGDLDAMRIEANRLGGRAFKEGAPLEPDMAGGMADAAGSMRDAIYPTVETAHGLPEGSLAKIKKLEGAKLNIEQNSPQYSIYHPTSIPLVALKKGLIDLPRLGAIRAQTLFERARIPSPSATYEAPTPRDMFGFNYSGGGETTALPDNMPRPNVLKIPSKKSRLGVGK